MKTLQFIIILAFSNLGNLFGQFRPNMTINAGLNNDLVFQTNGVERMIITNGGNVGIGENWPDVKFHVVNGHSSALANNASIGVFESNNNGFLSILTPGDKYAGLLFGSPKYKGGAINYNHTLEEMTLKTNGTDKMLINAIGNIGIGTNSPVAKLDINGDLKFSKILNLQHGNYSNLNRNGCTILSFSDNTPGNYTLSGIDGGIDGMMVFIYVGGGQSLTILNNNNLSSPSNKILSNSNADILINGGGATLIYMNTLWRVIGVAN